MGIWKWDAEDGECPSYLDEAILTPLEISQVVVWDETHKDAQIGDYGAGGRKTQVRFPCDEDGMCDPDGTIGPEKSYLNTKFNQQARFSFGCAIVELHNGATMGCRCTPFVYSDQWIKPFKKWRASSIKKSAESKGCLDYRHHG
ncbi:hypothetical protein H257_06902 [Aphanomyces astaci]|uniref:Uncharacterized protein n=1 Tax=Aphanomyces astaci TaxID=112090 RepID=W4GIX5_APHAT|nr:hypothetical protein H257_06902 [Aphanomyces astaci]ETV79645.1 hypothetical protein H257_06902 [Aphanomyces astaci]|eukprot:XP_009830581.1 hypothetical protein H257_06902 [Aphanomyces astaci]